MAGQKVHFNKIKEHLQELKDAKTLGIENRPATIGFHTSACSIDLLELYLHKVNLLEIGAQIKHDWFKRPKPGQKIIPLVERKLKINFLNKEKILEFLYYLEEKRNKLIYGSSTKIEIEQTINIFEEYKKLLKEMLKEAGEEIEE
ncbi:hypothetical protein HZA97_09885 [Candidatus Woesearchaeota archaeon]|nr:hypothetical protein [Candidatus Woesearchaeota archaeon]